MHVEKRLIQAQGCYERSEGQEDLANLPADLRIMGHPNGKKYCLGAKPAGRDDRHGAMDAKLPSFVGSCADHSPALDTAHNQRLAPEFGAIALLHGRIEGVHIDMDDGHYSFTNNHCTASIITYPSTCWLPISTQPVLPFSNRKTPAGSNWILRDARGINDSSQIVGIGANPDGFNHVNTPTPGGSAAQGFGIGISFVDSRTAGKLGKIS